MKIEDIVNLTEGILVNQPKVKAIEAATVYPSKVDHGDLFFSSSQDEIDKAVANGAYAIVYDNDEIIKKDDEIAWIKVGNIQLAALKLIRYVLLKKEAKFFLLAPHEISFLKMILLHKKNIAFIPGEWRKAFEMIINSNHHLFVGDDKALMQLIKPDVSRLENDVEGYSIFDTLFKTTFKVGGYVYQEMELAPFHLEYLLRVVDFCKKEDLPYKIDKIRYTKHFMPVFINAHLAPVPAGKSDKVAIFVDNIPDIVKAREYIRHSNDWIKGIVLTPPQTKVDGIDRPYWFKTEEEAKEILKNTLYNYAFIYSSDKSILRNMKEEYSLF